MTLYTLLETEMLKHANEPNAFYMAKYMRNQFLFYGIKTPLRRDIVKKVLKFERDKKYIDWHFVQLCYQSEYREMHQAALDYLTTKQRYLTFDDVERLFSLVMQQQWWDTIDRLDRIIGKIGLVDSRLDNVMIAWATHDNFWVRRIAIDHQIGRKTATNVTLLAQIICANFGSTEFFINKAIGWSLREYAKTDAVWVRAFVETHRASLHALSIREALKHLS